MGVGITFKWLKLYINMEMYYKYKIYLFSQFLNRQADARQQKHLCHEYFSRREEISKMTFGVQKKDNLLKEIKETKNQKKKSW